MKLNIQSGRFLMTACAFAATTLFSCQKTAQVTSSTGGDVQGDSLMAQRNAVNATSNESNVDNAIFTLITKEANTRDTVGCETRGFIPSDTSYPRTVNISFGAGCPDEFGRVRKGTMTITYSGPIDSAGSISATSFRNFYLDTVKISGKHLIQNVSRVGGAPIFSYLIERNSMYPDGDYSTNTANKIYIQTEGVGTETTSDDGFTISGTSMGVDYTGGQRTYYTTTTDIHHSLHMTATCEFPDAGQIVALVTIPKGGTQRETLKYGQHVCDDHAILVYKNQSMSVQLPLQFWPTF